jgi:hypothetical protein
MDKPESAFQDLRKSRHAALYEASSLCKRGVRGIFRRLRATRKEF